MFVILHVPFHILGHLYQHDVFLYKNFKRLPLFPFLSSCLNEFKGHAKIKKTISVHGCPDGCVVLMDK